MVPIVFLVPMTTLLARVAMPTRTGGVEECVCVCDGGVGGGAGSMSVGPGVMAVVWGGGGGVPNVACRFKEKSMSHVT